MADDGIRKILIESKIEALEHVKKEINEQIETYKRLLEKG